MISRFGLHLQLESHNKGEVYRVWTAGNFNPESSNMAPIERETVPQEVDESKSLVADLDFLENSSQPVQVLDTSTSVGNNRGNNKSEIDAAVITEASNGTTVDDDGSSNLLLQCNTQNSDVGQCNGVLAEELLQGSESVTNSNVVETRCLALVTPTRRRSHLRYPRLTMGATSSLREQRILNMLEVCPYFFQILFLC